MIDWLETVLTTTRPADLLRLVAVPVFGWAAYRDVQTRRVPNRTWLPLALLGVALLVWEVWAVSTGQSLGAIYTAQDRELFFLRIALSLGMVGSIGYLFYWFGGFGGADAKALIVLTVLFPTFPTYYFPEFTLPWAGPTGVGVFSLTILSNTVLVGVVFPVFIALRNALSGHVAKVMVVGKPVRTADVTDEYGSLLQTPDGFTRRGLDLDALRMYLRWRGLTLADVLADHERLRDPDSLPDEPNPPGDGSIPRDEGSAGVESDPDVATDGGTDEENGAMAPEEEGGPVDENDGGTVDENETVEGEVEDPWGAAAFLDDIEGTAYGTTPEGLREGLDVLVEEDVVWISPGMPFIVPMFAGLLVSLLYGDLLADLLSMLV